MTEPRTADARLVLVPLLQYDIESPLAPLAFLLDSPTQLSPCLSNSHYPESHSESLFNQKAIGLFGVDIPCHGWLALGQTLLFL